VTFLMLIGSVFVNSYHTVIGILYSVTVLWFNVQHGDQQQCQWFRRDHRCSHVIACRPNTLYMCNLIEFKSRDCMQLASHLAINNKFLQRYYKNGEQWWYHYQQDAILSYGLTGLSFDKDAIWVAVGLRVDWPSKLFDLVWFTLRLQVSARWRLYRRSVTD